MFVDCVVVFVVVICNGVCRFAFVGGLSLLSLIVVLCVLFVVCCLLCVVYVLLCVVCVLWVASCCFVCCSL